MHIVSLKYKFVKYEISFFVYGLDLIIVTYEQARRYIADVAKIGITLGLDNIRNLLNELGNPQDDLQFIHIAGTNGKGSVLAFISTIMEIAGYKTGRYISPTVLSYRERIQINRSNISRKDFVFHLSKIKKAINRLLEAGLPHPSVFEIETVLGFLYFKEQSCDIVVLETGMGGVDDATNVVKNTLVSVFTSVSRDHMEFLGDTIADLTRAKAGIIKKGGHVVYGKLPPDSEEIIEATAKQLNNPIHIAGCADKIIQNSKQKFSQQFSYKEIEDITIYLLGKHQVRNATLAIEVVHVLNRQGFEISDDQVKAGLRETRWFGRMTVVKEKNPVIIVDGAHNQEAASSLRSTLAELFSPQKIIGVMGAFKDKEVGEILTKIKDVMHEIHTISLPDKQRTISADKLKQFVASAGIEAVSHDLLVDAIRVAINRAGADGVVVAFGSLSFLGEVMKYVS